MIQAEENVGCRLFRWCQYVTVEPVLFLYMMAFMTTSVVEQAFFVDKACRVNHAMPPTVCDNINDNINNASKSEVQKTVSEFHQWNNIAGHLMPILLALFMGSWSDRRGRKMPLIIGLIGKLYYSTMVIVNASQPTWPLEYVIYTATIPMAFTGADVIIFAAAFSYISDVTSVENRTLRVTILDVCYLSTMPSGIALGKYLFRVTNRSFSIMFAINASLLALAIIYAAINLKWRTNERQSPLPNGACSWFGDFFDKDHVVQSLATLYKKRQKHRRTFLIIFIIIMALYTFQREEKPMGYLYLQHEFEWTVDKYSDFKTFQSCLYVIVMLCGVPILSHWLGIRDTIIIMMGAVSHAGARVIFALAQDSRLFYVGAVVCSLGPVIAPVLRSMTSKIVPVNERGKVFSLLSVADNAMPLLSGVMYSQLYNATLNSHPESIYWLTFSSQCMVFILILIVHISTTTESLIHDETEESQEHINTEESHENINSEYYESSNNDK